MTLLTYKPPPDYMPPEWKRIYEIYSWLNQKLANDKCSTGYAGDLRALGDLITIDMKMTHDRIHSSKPPQWKSFVVDKSLDISTLSDEEVALSLIRTYPGRWRVFAGTCPDMNTFLYVLKVRE